MLWSVPLRHGGGEGRGRCTDVWSLAEQIYVATRFNGVCPNFWIDVRDPPRGKMIRLNNFEQAVLDKLLDGDHAALKVLRLQANGARIAKREVSPVGFYCDFEVDVAAAVARGNFHIGDVHASILGLTRGAGFVLFVESGRIAMLEGYTYDEPWPDRVGAFSLFYTDPDRKVELAKLR
jgi:hypothetical protein